MRSVGSSHRGQRVLSGSMKKKKIVAAIARRTKNAMNTTAKTITSTEPTPSSPPYRHVPPAS
jgi:hypothetical protein